MTTSAAGPVSLLGADPTTYVPHLLHREGRTYQETNCYTDIVVELLHARGDEPLAALGFLVRLDFEGDQWTFFKPPPGDLERLYGIDIHEMQPYRPLPDQIAEQLGAGRTIIVELDAWYLPDTASTSYRADHVKTSVAVEGIDRAGQTLTYFHNAGLYRLEGEDYRGAFRLDGGWAGDVLPPYTELVRFDSGTRLDGPELRAAAVELLRGHLARRPARNPFDAFGEQLTADMPRLLEGDAELYHAYAFATVRMAGSAFEILAAHAEWLFRDSSEPIVAPLQSIVAGSKLLSLKLARRRAFDAGLVMGELAASWTQAMAGFDAAIG